MIDREFSLDHDEHVIWEERPSKIYFVIGRLGGLQYFVVFFFILFLLLDFLSIDNKIPLTAAIFLFFIVFAKSLIAFLYSLSCYYVLTNKRILIRIINWPSYGYLYKKFKSVNFQLSYEYKGIKFLKLQERYSSFGDVLFTESTIENLDKEFAEHNFYTAMKKGLFGPRIDFGGVLYQASFFDGFYGIKYPKNVFELMKREIDAALDKKSKHHEI